MDGSDQYDHPSALTQGKQLTVTTEKEAGGGRRRQRSDADQNVTLIQKRSAI